MDNMNNYSRNGGSYRPVAPRGEHPTSSDYSRDAVSARYGKQRRKKGRARIFAVVAVVVALIAAVGAGSAYAYYQSISGKLHQGVDQELRNALVEPAHADDPFYMLFMGVDSSEERESSAEYAGDNFRSDSMILARIDPKQKKVTMVSLHRDTMINMGTHGVQKLNAAHAFGGAAYTVKVVSELAGVDIAHYAEINFDGFADIVDSLGGVEVDVPMDITDEYVEEDLKAGWQTLNGVQALSLCRARHAFDNVGDGDIYRAANQRLVLGAIAKKVLSSDVSTMIKSIETMASYVTTDLDLTTIVSLANSMRGLDPSTDIYSSMEPTTSQYINGGWYEKLNLDAWTKMMKRVDAGLPPTEETLVDKTGAVLSSTGDGSTAGLYQQGATASNNSAANAGASAAASGKVAVRNGCGVAGIAADAAKKVESLGYTTETGNADDSNYTKTLVICESSDQSNDAQAIVDALGAGKVVVNEGTYSIPDGMKFLVVIGSDFK